MPGKNDSIFRRGFKTWAEKKAIGLREELKIHACGALPAEKLAEHLGVYVICISTLFPDPKDKELLMVKKPFDFSGIRLINSEGQNLVLHNGNHSPARIQSNIMHELAHVICDHKIPEEYMNIPIAKGMRYFSEEQEAEAKYLGGCLQMTRPGLVWCRNKNQTTEEICAYYNASKEMVIYRLKISGVDKQKPPPKNNSG